MARRSDPPPKHPAAVACEGDAQIVEVPKYRAKCPEECDAEDHVPLVQWDGVAIHRKELISNADADVLGKPTTLDAITVGDDDARAGAWRELEPNAVRHIPSNEVMCRAGIEQCDELLIANGDVEQHRVLCLDAGNGPQRDHGRVRLRCGWCRGILVVV
jgi:hypothetical protein